MMPNIIDHQKNADKSIMIYQIKKTMKIVGKDVEQLALSYAAGGSVKWYYPFKNHFGSFLQT